MSNRRRPTAKTVIDTGRLRLKVGLILDPEDPTDTTVQMVFRLATSIDVQAAMNGPGDPGGNAFTGTLAARTYLRTETMRGADLALPWDGLVQGILGDADHLSRLTGRREAPSNLHRALADVARFNGWPWDEGPTSG